MNLIGISGRMNSGKDTIGMMMQYLIMKSKFKFKHPSSVTDFNSYLANKHNHQSSWQIKKFATKVKEVCSILTGIPVEDFEKAEVKNSILGKEWDKVEYEPDGVLGTLQTKFEYQYTVRKLLQMVGTDAIRNVIHEDAWVNALFVEYKAIGTKLKEECNHPIRTAYDIGECCEDGLIYPNWIITDVRFPNEFNAIRNRNGIIIRVDRPDTEVSTHASETSLSDAEFDYTMLNNSDLEYLLWQVRMCLTHYQII